MEQLVDEVSVTQYEVPNVDSIRDVCDQFYDEYEKRSLEDEELIRALNHSFKDSGIVFDYGDESEGEWDFHHDECVIFYNQVDELFDSRESFSFNVCRIYVHESTHAQQSQEYTKFDESDENGEYKMYAQPEEIDAYAREAAYVKSTGRKFYDIKQAIMSVFDDITDDELFEMFKSDMRENQDPTYFSSKSEISDHFDGAFFSLYNHLKQS
jgi:hypothetical protein